MPTRANDKLNTSTCIDSKYSLSIESVWLSRDLFCFVGLWLIFDGDVNLSVINNK